MKFPQTQGAPKHFLKQTRLVSGQYRRRYRQIDRDALEVVRSPEALAVTIAMGTIYAALVDAPPDYIEAEGVLHFGGETVDGKRLTAVQQLAAYVGLAVGTVLKGMRFLDEKGVIGYSPYKNGIGIRIFINLAASSVAQRADGGQKNLPVRSASNFAPHTSNFSVPFKDSYAVEEDIRNKESAPKNGTNIKSLIPIETDDGGFRDPIGDLVPKTGLIGIDLTFRDGAASHRDYPHGANQHSADPRNADVRCSTAPATPTPMDAAITQNLKLIVEAAKSAAYAAAHDAARLTAERTACVVDEALKHQRENSKRWLEESVMPKIARVAQAEAYKVHRSQSNNRTSAERTLTELMIGKSSLPSSTSFAAPAQINLTDAVQMCLTAHSLGGMSSVEQALNDMHRSGELTREGSAAARVAVEAYLLKGGVIGDGQLSSVASAV